MEEIGNFAMDLEKANKDGIGIDGIDVCDRPVDRAVETIYWNAVNHLPEGARKTPLLACILWEIQKKLVSVGPDARIYCLNRFDEIALSGFDKARLLLLSQCDLACPDEFVPLQGGDWGIIEDAIGILGAEKNGERKAANALLRKLKDSGRYATEFGKWNEPQESSDEYSEFASD
jgi:hypothetical protein